MFRKTATWLSAALLAAGIGFFSTDTASAQWYQQGHNYRSHGYNYNNSYYRGYGNYGYQNYYPNRGTHYHYHDTSHYDYHPPSIRWHGNHIDVTPGHYHWHRQGHWDRH